VLVDATCRTTVIIRLPTTGTHESLAHGRALTEDETVRQAEEVPALIPVLFHVGPFSVRAYGVMLAISFLLGAWWATRAGARRGIDADRILSLVGWILVSSIVGARLHFVIAHPSSFAGPFDFLRIWEGGLTLYGGLIAAVVVSFLYLRRHRLGFLPVADAVAPALALGEGVTRIGCFLNGCCFGARCHGAFAIHYPPESYAALTLGRGVAVYPAQLYLCAAMLLLFAILWRLDRRGLAPGFLFGFYLIGQGIARYVVDFYRYYEEVDRIPSLAPILGTKSQLIAVVLALLGVIVVARARRGNAAAGARR
jgi:phosphatidylglycerol---prolipoprotein diacylglyceryl transferase